MKKILSLLALLAFSSAAMADEDKTFSWTAPTEYTNNTPILPGDLSSFRITCNDVIIAEVGANLTSYTMNLTTGEYSCHIQALTLTAISENSATVTTEAAGDPPLIPMAIMDFTIT